MNRSSHDPEAVTGCADKLKALAEPTRLAVVEELMEGARSVGQLTATLQVEQTLLSHHLRVLREAGLVIAEADGRTRRYALAPGVEIPRGRPGVELGCCRLSFPEGRD